MFFAWRSFYGMRIDDGKTPAPAAHGSSKKEEKAE
jgi:hypothetical protein